MGMYIQYSLMLFKAKIEVKLILGKEKKNYETYFNFEFSVGCRR